MKIYHASITRSVRIVWLCEELGLDYELEVFKLGDPSAGPGVSEDQSHGTGAVAN